MSVISSKKDQFEGLQPVDAVSMRLVVNKLVKLTSILLFALTILTGCGGGSKDGNNPQPQPQPQTYTVSFITNGGSSVASRNLQQGGVISTSPETTRDGYDFEGWFTDNNTFTNKVSFPYIPIGNITLYANWTQIAVTPLCTTNGINATAIVKINSEQDAFALSTPICDHPLLSENIPGYLEATYDFYYDGDFDSAIITFTYDLSLGAIGDDFQPRIYYFNERLGTLEELPNQSIANGEVTAVVGHFSKYTLMNSVEFNRVLNGLYTVDIRKPADLSGKEHLDIMFVIDESNSMENMQNMCRSGFFGMCFDWYTAADNNDPGRLRISATKTFIDAMSVDDRAGIIGFSDNARLISGLTPLSNKETVKSQVDGIRGDVGGTAIYTGLNAAISHLISNGRSNADKIIIVLTDGEDDPPVPQTTYEAIADTASQNGITIFSIGLSVNPDVLRLIADRTNGSNYYSPTAEFIDGVFTFIKDKTIDYIIDSNDDGIPDYYAKLIFDGVLPLTNGSTQFKGIDFESNADYDGDGLKNGEELIVTTRELTIDGITRIYVMVIMVSDPTKKDTDGDGIDDGEDPFPLNKNEYNEYADDTVYSKALAEKAALYSMLAYDEMRFTSRSNPVPLEDQIESIPPNVNTSFDMLVKRYNELINRNDLRYYNGTRKDAVSKIFQYYHSIGGDNTPVVLMAQLLHDGYQEIESRYYGDNIEDNISYTFAYKPINGNEYLVAVILRGTDSVEWYGNMDICGESSETCGVRHASFENANRLLRIFLIDYIEKTNLTGKDVRFLLTGHSRGGAVANLLSLDLKSSKYTAEYGLGVTNRAVYTYTFAAPNNTIDPFVAPNNAYESKDYGNIFNFEFNDDFVPQVPLAKWSYTKIGETISKTANTLYNNNGQFKDIVNELSQLSRGRDAYFDSRATNIVIGVFYELAPTVNDYYTKKHSHGFRSDMPNETLYEYMRNTIAKVLVQGFGAPFEVLSVVLPAQPDSDFKDVKDFFVEGGDVNNMLPGFIEFPWFKSNIFDTHSAYTYYFALKSGAFDK